MMLESACCHYIHILPYQKMVQKNRGRIRPDDRDADDNVAIIGAEIELDEAHQQGVDETNDHKRRQRTKNSRELLESDPTCLHIH